MSETDYFAVIDIGSNSVRLVVYSGRERVPATVFNEKTLAGLGGEVGETGRMGDKAMDEALDTLRRYRVLCDQMGVREIEAVATAAVRDATNGEDFVRRVKAECDFDIRTIAGEEEGRLSAIGVLSGDPDARGVMGDLGGGSLELSRLKEGRVTRSISLPIGPLRLISRFGTDIDAMRHHVKEELASVDWREKADGEALYVVGGAWRNLAKLMMREQFVPLPVLQGFIIRRADMLEYSKRIASLRPEDIPYGNTLATRRLEILPIAAMILRQVLKAISVREVAISTHGLREGLLFEKLAPDVQAKDPYIYQCRDLAQERSRFAEHADLLYHWTRPLFPQSALASGVETRRLHLAACLLSDIAWRGHPDFRAERAVEVALHGQFVGVSHAGRAFVAVALNQAYGANHDRDQIGQILPLLTAGQMMEARVLGAALRLAQRLSGGAAAALQSSMIVLSDRDVMLSAPAENRHIINAVVTKRLKALGQLLARRTAVSFYEPDNADIDTDDESDAA